MKTDAFLIFEVQYVEWPYGLTIGSLSTLKIRVLLQKAFQDSHIVVMAHGTWDAHIEEYSSSNKKISGQEKNETAHGFLLSMF